MFTALIAVIALAQYPDGQVRRTLPNTTELNARPLDLVASPDGSRLFVKTHGPLLVLDRGGKVLSRNTYPGGASLYGIALDGPGKRVVVSDATSSIHIGSVDGDKISWSKTIEFGKPKVGGAAFPCGITRLSDGKFAVALSRSNAVAIVDIDSGVVQKEIAVDPAPYGLALSPDGKQLVVSCWSRAPRTGERTVESSGTAVPVTEKSTASEGSMDLVDLDSGSVVKRVTVGLQPTEIAIAKDGVGYVAVANGDAVAVLDLASFRVLRMIETRSNRAIPPGSAPNGVSLSLDEKRLYVALGGADSVAVFSREGSSERLIDVLPTTWYPGVVREVGNELVVGTIKGAGIVDVPADAKGHNSHQHSGNILRYALSSLQMKPSPWKAVGADSDTEMAAVRKTARAGVLPAPVPERVGEPSVFEHVVYILKENRTYDQVLGDMKQGNGDPNLTMYGRIVTPNQHAVAEQFVLLDNFMCNSVLSADGHAWAMEGNATTYFERSFGGWTRSYPFGGDDPLAVSSTGFIWDATLKAGKTLRNFGEFDYADTVPASRNFTQIYNDFLAGKTEQFSHNMSVAKLIANSNTTYPGWNLKIPDVVRASIFLKEFREWEVKGSMPSLTIIYLPQNHTSGTGAGNPTPRAMVADNDLAYGQIVDAISHSKFWPKTCIFTMEDDPQDGFDHVDGRRSPCLIVSPYTKRSKVVSHFYNQTSVLHTMLQILGVKPTTQFIALAPLMTDCFQTTPNLKPFSLRKNLIALDEMNPKPAALRGKAKRYALASAKMDLSVPDKIDDDLMNRVLWFAAKGDKPYPAKYVGARSGPKDDD